MKICLDLSYWDSDLTASNWEVINRGIDGLIIRLGYAKWRDGYAQTHINWCKKFGKPYAGYWYVYTATDINEQVAAIKAAVEELKPCVLWLDVEDVDPSPLSIAQRAAYYKTLREKVGAVVTISKGCYSADWYLDRFNVKDTLGRIISRPLDWVRTDTYWEAAYMAWYEAAWWAAFKARWGIFDIEKMHEVADYVQVHNGVMRQIESKVPVAGLPLSMDWNIISDLNFVKLFTNGANVPYELPEYLPYIVNTIWGVNVRATPSVTGTKYGAIEYKTIVQILTKNITAGWGQIATGEFASRWVFLANLKAL